MSVLNEILTRFGEGIEVYQRSIGFNTNGVKCEGHVVNRLIVKDGKLYSRTNTFHSQLPGGYWGEFVECNDFDLDKTYITD